jgi:hypothetical protein
MDTTSTKFGLGAMLFTLAVSFATIYTFAYVAGKGWSKATK